MGQVQKGVMWHMISIFTLLGHLIRLVTLVKDTINQLIKGNLAGLRRRKSSQINVNQRRWCSSDINRYKQTIHCKIPQTQKAIVVKPKKGGKHTDLLCKIYWTVFPSDQIFLLTLWAASPGDSSPLSRCSPGLRAHKPASWPNQSPSGLSGSLVSCDCGQQTCEVGTWVCSPCTGCRRHPERCTVPGQTGLYNDQNIRDTLWSFSRFAPTPESPTPCCSEEGKYRRRWARCKAVQHPSEW